MTRPRILGQIRMAAVRIDKQFYYARIFEMKQPLDLPAAEGSFAALGNRTRIEILRLLVRAGREGLNVGGIQEELALPGSTLSHHIDALSRTELVLREPRGREVICRSNNARIRALSEYLLESCCSGSAKKKSPLAA